MLIPVNQLPLEESERERPRRGRPPRREWYVRGRIINDPGEEALANEWRGQAVEGTWIDDVSGRAVDLSPRLPVAEINALIARFYELGRTFQRLTNSGVLITDALGNATRAYSSSTTYAMNSTRANMRNIEERLRSGIIALDSGEIQTVPPIRGLDRLPLRALPNNLVQARFSPDPDYERMRTDVTVR